MHWINDFTVWNILTFLLAPGVVHEYKLTVGFIDSVLCLVVSYEGCSHIKTLLVSKYIIICEDIFLGRKNDIGVFFLDENIDFELSEEEYNRYE